MDPYLTPEEVGYFVCLVLINAVVLPIGWSLRNLSPTLPFFHLFSVDLLAYLSF